MPFRQLLSEKWNKIINTWSEFLGFLDGVIHPGEVPVKNRARAKSGAPVVGVDQAGGISQPIKPRHLSNDIGNPVTFERQLQLLVVSRIVTQTLKTEQRQLNH